MQQNFNVEVEEFILSTHIYPYLERYGFFAFLWSLKEGGMSPVDIEEHCHKLFQSLK